MYVFCFFKKSEKSINFAWSRIKIKSHDKRRKGKELAKEMTETVCKNLIIETKEMQQWMKENIL